MTTMGIVVGIIIIIISLTAGWIFNSFFGKNSYRTAKEKSDRILKDALDEAENAKKEKLIEAEEKIYLQRQKSEEEFKTKKNSLRKVEADLSSKENNIDRKADLIAKKEREIFLQKRDIQNKENQLNI
ncbi:MAG: Rnase Y domain-containing protein, partial [Calditrichales bacterium]|nr:Rnase Y domain-containing protein [Calditrichales bacterium]